MLEKTEKISEAIIDNVYVGYCESNEEPIFIQKINKLDDNELAEIFMDLAQHCGTYKYRYIYDNKTVSIISGSHTPVGEMPKQITREWLDYDISKMQNWALKNRLKNCIS